MSSFIETGVKCPDHQIFSICLPAILHSCCHLCLPPPPFPSTARTHAFVIRAVLLVQSKHTSACSFICCLCATSPCENVNEDAVAPILSVLLWTICSAHAGSSLQRSGLVLPLGNIKIGSSSSSTNSHGKTKSAALSVTYIVKESQDRSSKSDKNNTSEPRHCSD